MIEHIRELIHREPFQPFRVVTTSGDKYEISSLDLIALLESQVFIAFPRSDRWALLRLNQIVAVKSLASAA